VLKALSDWHTQGQITARARISHQSSPPRDCAYAIGRTVSRPNNHNKKTALSAVRAAFRPPNQAYKILIGLLCSSAVQTDMIPQQQRLVISH